MAIWTSVPLGMLFSSTVVGEWGLPPTIGQAVPVVRSTNITNDGKLDMHDIVYRHVPTERLQPRRIQAGNILVEKSGGGPQQPAGRVAYCEHEIHGTSSNFIEIVRVDKKYDSKFVFYLLHYLYKSGLVLKYQQQTTGIINFKFREYQTECVRVPESKQEQAAIAEILTTVDQAIAQTEALIAKQQRIKAGLLHDLLTRGIDDAGRLRDICQRELPLSEIAEINPRRPQLNMDECEAVSFIPMSDVTENARWANRQTRPLHQVKRGYTYFQENDVLVAKITPCAENGKGCLARGLTNGIGFGSTEFHVLRARDNADAGFLYHLSTYKAFREQAAAKMTGSAGQQRVPESFLIEYRVAAYSKDEQSSIAAVLDASDDLLIAEEANLEKYYWLKAGLMRDLLTGIVSATSLLSVSAGKL